MENNYVKKSFGEKLKWLGLGIGYTIIGAIPVLFLVLALSKIISKTITKRILMVYLYILVILLPIVFLILAFINTYFGKNKYRIMSKKLQSNILALYLDIILVICPIVFLIILLCQYIIKCDAKSKNSVYIPKIIPVPRKRLIVKCYIYIGLILLSATWLLPFIFIFFESFRTESTYQVGYIIPYDWGFDNYINLCKKTKFLTWYRNTLIIGIVVAVVQTLMVLTTSYTLSRLRFKGRKFLMNMMLILGMFPGFITMIVLYKVLQNVKLVESNAIFGLMIVYSASSGMGYYISKGFFDTIPKSLDEVARVCGATRFQVLRKVILPLSKPIIIYTVLMAFMQPWGDFMFAKYISHLNSDGYTVAVGLQYLVNTSDGLANYYTMFCAGGVLVALPITILFMLLQKYYVEGVTGGAVKG